MLLSIISKKIKALKFKKSSLEDYVPPEDLLKQTRQEGHVGFDAGFKASRQLPRFLRQFHNWERY